jgi:prevent-host-death family protein
MAQVTIREARINLKALIDRAEAGEEIVILRRGRQVARLMPPERQSNRFPDLEPFRASIAVRGEPLSETVIRERRESRY